MAALLHDHRPPAHSGFPQPVARFFALEALPDPAERPEVPARPDLRVLPGGADAVVRVRRPAAVYRRRRLTVLAAAVVLLALAAAGVATAAPLAQPSRTESSAGDPTASAATPALVAAPAGPADLSTDSYVVQPGDTLWQIAAGLDPDGDIRSLVDQLADLAGPGPLEAGERLDLTQIDP